MLRFGLLCSATMLAACAAIAPPPISADAAYRMGRHHQLARSHADAMRLYRQALAADPQHVDARNGLATLLAEQGDLAAAIALWQSLTAQPASAAYLFSNLGYAYYLDGQYAAARQALERACLLDPANALAWQRLASTLDKLGDDERAARLQHQAETLAAHDVRADAVTAQLELVTGPDGLLTLQRTAGPASLEISNGNGVPGMARATALRLRDPSWQVVRLRNERSFTVQRTRIEYPPALHEAARRLAQQVQPDALLVEMPLTGLRLVLGRNARI